jgi:hypothetical protein
VIGLRVPAKLGKATGDGRQRAARGWREVQDDEDGGVDITRERGQEFAELRDPAGNRLRAHVNVHT